MYYELLLVYKTSLYTIIDRPPNLYYNLNKLYILVSKILFSFFFLSVKTLKKVRVKNVKISITTNKLSTLLSTFFTLKYSIKKALNTNSNINTGISFLYTEILLVLLFICFCNFLKAASLFFISILK